MRYQLAHRYARTDENRPLIAMVTSQGNFYESLGLLMKTGLVEPELALEMWSGNADSEWENLMPVTAIYRRTGGDGLWENFEYLAVLSKDWLAAHPKGAYPSVTRRLEVKNEFLEADKQYASSLAPA